jgi:hypothetical protein
MRNYRMEDKKACREGYDLNFDHRQPLCKQHGLGGFPLALRNGIVAVSWELTIKSIPSSHNELLVGDTKSSNIE